MSGYNSSFCIFFSGLPNHVDLSAIVVSWRFRDPRFHSPAHLETFEPKHRQVVLSEHIQRGASSDVVQHNVMVNNTTNVLIHPDSTASLRCGAPHCHNMGSRPSIDWVPYNTASDRSYFHSGSFNGIHTDSQLGNSNGQRMGLEIGLNSLAPNGSMISAAAQYPSRNVSGYDLVRQMSPHSVVSSFGNQNGNAHAAASHRFAVPSVCEPRSNREYPKYGASKQNDAIYNLLQQPKQNDSIHSLLQQPRAADHCAVEVNGPMCFNPGGNAPASLPWSKNLVPFTSDAGVRPSLRGFSTVRPVLPASNAAASLAPVSKRNVVMKPVMQRMSVHVTHSMPTTQGQMWSGCSEVIDTVAPFNKWKHGTSQPVLCTEGSRSIVSADVSAVSAVLDKSFTHYNLVNSIASNDCPSVSSSYSIKCSFNTPYANSLLQGSDISEGTLLVPSPDIKVPSECGEIDILAKATEELFSPNSDEQLIDEDLGVGLLDNDSSVYNCISVMQPSEYELSAQKDMSNFNVLEQAVDSRDSGFSARHESVLIPSNQSGLETETDSVTTQTLNSGDMLQVLVLNNQGYLEKAGEISSGSLEGHEAVAVEYCRMEDMSNNNKPCLSNTEGINGCEQPWRNDECIEDHSQPGLLNEERVVLNSVANVVCDEVVMSKSVLDFDDVVAVSSEDTGCVSSPSTIPQQSVDVESDISSTLKCGDKLETFIVTFSEKDLYEMVDRVESMQTVGECYKRKRLDIEDDVSSKRRQHDESAAMKDSPAADNCGNESEAVSLEPLVSRIKRITGGSFVVVESAIVDADALENSNADESAELSKTTDEFASEDMKSNLVPDMSGDFCYIGSKTTAEPPEDERVQEDTRPALEGALFKNDDDVCNLSGTWMSSEQSDKDDDVFMQHTQDEDSSRTGELSATNRRNCFDFLHELASNPSKKLDAGTLTNGSSQPVTEGRSFSLSRSTQQLIENDTQFNKSALERVMDSSSLHSEQSDARDKTIGVRDLYLSSGFAHSLHSSSSSSYEKLSVADVSSSFEQFELAPKYDSDLLSTSDGSGEVALKNAMMQRCISPMTDKNDSYKSYESSSPSPPSLSPSNSYFYGMPMVMPQYDSEASNDCCPTLESDIVIDSARRMKDGLENREENDSNDGEKEHELQTDAHSCAKNLLKNTELLLAQYKCTECVVELCSVDCKNVELHRLQRIQLSIVGSNCSRLESFNGH